MTTTDLSKLRKADLVELVEKMRRDLCENVAAYPEGCDEGRIEFLRDCGVPDDMIGDYYDLIPPAPRTVVLTIAFTPTSGWEPQDLVTRVQTTLDNSDVVDGRSAYGVEIHGYTRAPEMLNPNADFPEDWSGVSDWQGFYCG